MLYFAKWKTALILGIVAAGILFALPNLVPAMRTQTADGTPVERSFPFNYLPGGTINLGLDLQGGVYMVLGVDVESVKENQVQGIFRQARSVMRGDPTATPPEPGIATTNWVREGERIGVSVVNPGDMDAALERLRGIAEPVNEGALGLGSQAKNIDVKRLNETEIDIRITDEQIEETTKRTVESAIKVLRNRIDPEGTLDPSIQRKGENQIVLQIPGLRDRDRLERLINQTARMTFHVVSYDQEKYALAEQGLTPPDVLYLDYPDPENPAFEGRKILVEKQEVLTGEDLANASRGNDQDGDWVVNFRFDQRGARIFADITTRYRGQQFAVVLDDVVITAPTIRSPITGGSGYIEGGFTPESAQELATLLNAGALPADLSIDQESTVSAELGADSIRAGQIALAIGFVGVILFMIASYWSFGVIANLALLANVGLIVGALSALGATLTLPGIAGIILTIGMAVDANVLIFERVREERYQGRTPINAIETGYARALSTIMDANITTFIAAAILYQFGSGPVKGFAVTLAIGIVTSVFTAFVFSRLLVAWWIKWTRPKTLPFDDKPKPATAS